MEREKKEKLVLSKAASPDKKDFKIISLAINDWQTGLIHFVISKPIVQDLAGSKTVQVSTWTLPLVFFPAVH